MLPKILPKSLWSCDEDPYRKIAKGTVVVMPGIWSWGKDNRVTPQKDIRVTMQQDCLLVQALCIAEKAALDFVRSHGADDIRYHFVEGVREKSGEIWFELGT